MLHQIYKIKNGDNYLPQQNNTLYFTGILFLFIILCFVFISVWIVLIWMENAQQQTPLSKLIITGRYQYTTINDIKKSILASGVINTFMTQDVNVIQRQIENIPWIKQVSIRKQWPDKLKIHLIEYVPIASWNNKYMIDIDGNAFFVPTVYANKQDLPKLHGPKGSEKIVLQGFQEMKQILADKRLILKEVIMTARHSWQLILMNGIKLNLGRNDLINRLTRFITFYPMLLQQTHNIGKWINYVDLRYNSGIAVSWTKIPIGEANK